MLPLENPYADLEWDRNGAPRSVKFDDKYFCQDNGYDEAVHVNCHGNALSERFGTLSLQNPGIFTIVETGFGTGLDFCCVWQLWDAKAPPSWKLRFISLELYPVKPEQMSRALGLWPQLTPYRDELVCSYAPHPGSVQDLYLAGGRVHLTIVFDDVINALQLIQRNGLAGEGADACFLDGFAPSKNPAMWSKKVFQALKDLCRPGTTFSTFTVAGSVRRGLSEQGFLVQKVPGHGKKRHILTGTFTPSKTLPEQQTFSE